MTDCELIQAADGDWYCRICDPHRRQPLPDFGRRNCRKRGNRVRRSGVDRLLNLCRIRRQQVGPAIGGGRDDAWILAILDGCQRCDHWIADGGCDRLADGCRGRNAFAAILVGYGTCPHAPRPEVWESPQE